jgi:hypothetical protein
MLEVVSYKICVTCDKCKNILEFYRMNSTRDGFNYSCKECINEKNKIHRNKDIEHSRKISRDSANRYYDKNKDEIQEKARSDRRKNKGVRNEKYLARRRRYYQNNKEQVKESRRKDYEKNKEARDLSKKEYAERTKDKRNKYANNWVKEKYKNDPKFRVGQLVRTRLQSAFKEFSKNGKINTCNEYGIDFDAIYKHVGDRPGSGKDWHLDHIIPICVFDFDNQEHIKLSHTPENLRWLPGRLNESKGKNYVKEIFDSEILVNILRIIGKYEEAYEFLFW